MMKYGSSKGGKMPMKKAMSKSKSGCKTSGSTCNKKTTARRK
jgi:hypothetical protein